MLDHVFTDAIGAMKVALEDALLERNAFEEHFQLDVLLGDIVFESSYHLPGEGDPPRIQVNISLDWPTWSQTAYRLWYIGEDSAEPPKIDIELALRIQRLGDFPDHKLILGCLPEQSAAIGNEPLARTGPTVETLIAEPDKTSYAIEVRYEGTYELSEQALRDGADLDEHFRSLGGWIASMLVQLGDLKLRFTDASA